MESLHQPKGSFTTAIWVLFLLTLVTIMVLSVVNKNLSKFIFFILTQIYIISMPQIDTVCPTNKSVCLLKAILPVPPSQQSGYHLY